MYHQAGALGSFQSISPVLPQATHLSSPLCSTIEVSLCWPQRQPVKCREWLEVSERNKEGLIFQTEDMHAALTGCIYGPWQWNKLGISPISQVEIIQSWAGKEANLQKHAWLPCHTSVIAETLLLNCWKVFWFGIKTQLHLFGEVYGFFSQFKEERFLLESAYSLISLNSKG